jgi:hypothetical protein
VNNCHNKGTKNVNQIKIVSKIREVLFVSRFPNLNNLVQHRVRNQRKHHNQEHLVFLNPLASSFASIFIHTKSFGRVVDVHLIGVNKQNHNVDEVNDKTKQMELVAKLIPFEFNQVLQCVRFKNRELFGLRTLIKKINILVRKFQTLYFGIDIDIFVQIRAD